MKMQKSVQSLHTIDAESKQFIKWTREHLNDPDYFSLLSYLIDRQLWNFLNGDKQKLLTALTEKMTKGAIEHGKPTHTKEQVLTELQQELLDLIGWNMVMLWNKRKEKTRG